MHSRLEMPAVDQLTNMTHAPTQQQLSVQNSKMNEVLYMHRRGWKLFSWCVLLLLPCGMLCVGQGAYVRKVWGH